MATLYLMVGLPCSGKTTLALHLEKALYKSQKATVVIDGDIVRNGLNKDLNFSVNSRYENIRRIAEVSKLLLNNGIIVIVSLVSPLTELREMAKEIIDDDVNGLLFDAGNEKELADKISYIINNPNLIEILGAKGQKTYQDNFTEELFIKKLIEVI